MSPKVPSGWQEVRIASFARESFTRNCTRGDIPVLSVTKHNGFVRADEYFSKTVHSSDTENYKIVQRGQFAYATIYLDEGSIDLLKDHDEGLISPMYMIFEITQTRSVKISSFEISSDLRLAGDLTPSVMVGSIVASRFRSMIWPFLNFLYHRLRNNARLVRYWARWRRLL